MSTAGIIANENSPLASNPHVWLLPMFPVKRGRRNTGRPDYETRTSSHGAFSKGERRPQRRCMVTSDDLCRNSPGKLAAVAPTASLRSGSNAGTPHPSSSAGGLCTWGTLERLFISIRWRKQPFARLVAGFPLRQWMTYSPTWSGVTTHNYRAAYASITRVDAPSAAVRQGPTMC